MSRRRATWRRLASLGLGAVAFAASLTLASADPSGAPLPGGDGIFAPSPEAAPKFGEPGGESALLAALSAARAASGPALDISWLTEPKFDLASAARGAPGALAPFAAAPGEAPAQQDAAPAVAAETPAPPPSPMQSALQAALDRLVARADRTNPLGAGDWRAARAAVADFYAARLYAPVWVDADGLTRAGRAALSQLERARDDGLDLSAFPLPHALNSGLEPEALAEAETTIASAIVAYAEQATGSRVPPQRVSPIVFLAPAVADPGVALAETAAAPDPTRRLADFNPPQRGYRALRDEWRRLIDATPDDAEPRVSMISAGVDPEPAAEARRRRRSGAGERVRTASASGSLAFGVTLARQQAAILANMEMWRWEPRDMGERRIEVNVADFSVAMLEGDEVLFQSRVIVGKPETPTPLFSSVMRYVQINPWWDVPNSIIRKELMPKLAYLSRHGYEVKTVEGRLTVRQQPGRNNALGRIAFMFPNDHAIYLHDTPARELFDKETRAFSHGCVRVEDPVRLGELVLDGDTSGWTEKRIEGLFGDRERTVFLPRPLPVHLEYFTEFVDESGELQERPDLYGLTRRVEGILARASQG